MDTIITVAQPVHYPESDGKPMAETDVRTLNSQALSSELRVEEGHLRVVDLSSGERLLTPAEVHAARRAEAATRQAAEARASIAEAELERLRGELAAPARGNATMIEVTASRRRIRAARKAARIASCVIGPRHPQLASA